jgi:hypothetical protein
MHILCTLQYEYNVASVHGTATLVSMFDSSAIDFRLDLHSVQTKDYKIVYERFSAKHTSFRGRSKVFIYQTCSLVIKQPSEKV